VKRLTSGHGGNATAFGCAPRDDDDVAFLPTPDPSGVMPDPRLAPSTTTSTSTSTTTLSQEKPAGGLSVTQVCGGALAAVTAAVAASFLGVGGTLIGAGVGSVISTIAAALYSNSLSRAARASRTLVVRQTLAPPEPDPQPQVAEPPGEPAPEPHPVRDSLWRQIRWKPVLLVAGGVFVVAMAVISVSELVLGHPIANAGESGTTLSNIGGSSSSSTSPAPTGTQSPSPSGTASPTPSDSSSTDASPDRSATSPSLAPNTTAPTDPTTVPTPGSATTAPSTATTAPTGAGSSSGG
jgi:hypothetical protein